MGLKEYRVNLSAIVAMSDSGGSTGILRDELGALPPGDIRRALVALSQSPQIIRDLFNYRFQNGGLGGHSFGNLFIATLTKITGSFEKAIEETSRILKLTRKIQTTSFGSRLKVKAHEKSKSTLPNLLNP